MDLLLASVKGIGPSRLAALHEAGIFSVRDLVMFLPRDYRDLTQTTPLDQVRAGETVAVRVRVAGEVSEQRARKLLITRVYVTDGTETLPVVWYNQPWLKNNMEKGRELLLYGKFELRRGYLQMLSPTIEQDEGLVPVYRAIPGIPAKVFRQLMTKALSSLEGQWPDELPEALRIRYGLCERNFAMRSAHFPDSREALEAARRRIAFEELLLYQVALGLVRSGTREGIRLDFDPTETDAYWSRLPFPPTNAQRRVLEEISADLRAPGAMARLVQGDVGCGKTAIAFGAITLAWKAGSTRHSGCRWRAPAPAPRSLPRGLCFPE